MSQSTIEKNLIQTQFGIFTPTHNLAELFTKEPGKKIVEEMIAPNDFVQQVVQVNLQEGKINESQIFPLGAPQMRTLWQVQSISISFSAFVFASGALPIPLSGEVGRYQIGANVWIGGRSYPFFLTEVPMSNITGWENVNGAIKSGNGAEYVKRRQYVLELFSPIELSKAQDLAISLFMVGTEKQKLPKQMSVMFINPLVIVNYDAEVVGGQHQ